MWTIILSFLLGLYLTLLLSRHKPRVLFFMYAFFALIETYTYDMYKKIRKVLRCPVREEPSTPISIPQTNVRGLHNLFSVLQKMMNVNVSVSVEEQETTPPSRKPLNPPSVVVTPDDVDKLD